MRATLSVQIVLSIACATVTSAIGLAQVPASHMLPDAPSKAPGFVRARERAVEGRAIEAEKRQMQPSFATSLTAREKYALAYRRIVSPEMVLRAAFVSGFDLSCGHRA